MGATDTTPPIYRRRRCFARSNTQPGPFLLLLLLIDGDHRHTPPQSTAAIIDFMKLTISLNLAPPQPSRTWRYSLRHRWIVLMRTQVVSSSQGMTWHAALRWRDVKDLSLDFTFTEESLGNNI